MVEQVIDGVVAYLGQSVGEFVYWAILALLALLARKLGLSISNDRQGKIEHYARQAAIWAEERAEAAARAGAAKWSAHEKAAAALDKFLGWVPWYKWIPGGRDKAADLIVSVLPSAGLGAIAASVAEGNGSRPAA